MKKKKKKEEEGFCLFIAQWESMPPLRNIRITMQEKECHSVFLITADIGIVHVNTRRKVRLQTRDLRSGVQLLYLKQITWAQTARSL